MSVGLRASTVTPGMTAPLASRTTPAIAPGGPDFTLAAEEERRARIIRTGAGGVASRFFLNVDRTGSREPQRRARTLVTSAAGVHYVLPCGLEGITSRSRPLREL